MKKHILLTFGLVVSLTTVFLSCKDNEPDDTNKPTAIELSKTEIQVEEGKTANLAVKFTPTDATGDVTWTSEDKTIATVENGIVTGVKAGSTTVVATCGSLTASCEITVTEASSIDSQKLLGGSDYYVFSMDETTFDKIKDKVKKDYRINGDYADEAATSVLEVWGNSFGEGTISGPNSLGLQESWISLLSQEGEGWGLGCGGIRQRNTTIDLTGVTNDHVLVITYKANSSVAAEKVKFTLYSTNSDVEIPIEVSANTQGEWVKVEKSMKDLFTEGLSWNAAFIDGTTTKTDGSLKAFYTIGLLINGVGNQLDVDAVFIYKPAAQ
ncbi:MAG: Ig-like domain-containing protein [Paludibacter sp.]|nr:Ig-like domain-containing protein [Paludibacter sp.]